jgi:hypothetical protein
MDAQLIAALKARHDFEGWNEPEPGQPSFLVWRYFLGGRELPGWRAHRIQPIGVPGSPPAHHSVWQRTDGRGQVLLALDVYECASGADAREFLVRVMAEFQSPLLERLQTVGDVAFALPGEGAIAFVRGNLVVILRNAGDETIPLGDLARRFDENLRARPQDGGPWEEAPAIARFEPEAERVAPGEPIPLRLDIAAPARPVWFKLFGPAGSLTIEADRPVFLAAAAGPQDIIAFAITREGGIATRTLRLDVEEPPA